MRLCGGGTASTSGVPVPVPSWTWRWRVCGCYTLTHTYLVSVINLYLISKYSNYNPNATENSILIPLPSINQLNSKGIGLSQAQSQSDWDREGVLSENGKCKLLLWSGRNRRKALRSRASLGAWTCDGVGVVWDRKNPFRPELLESFAQIHRINNNNYPRSIHDWTRHSTTRTIYSGSRVPLFLPCRWCSLYIKGLEAIL